MRSRDISRKLRENSTQALLSLQEFHSILSLEIPKNYHTVFAQTSRSLASTANEKEYLPVDSICVTLESMLQQRELSTPAHEKQCFNTQHKNRGQIHQKTHFQRTNSKTSLIIPCVAQCLKSIEFFCALHVLNIFSSWGKQLRYQLDFHQPLHQMLLHDIAGLLG